MATQNLPTLLCHSDWGSHPRKRWLCKAHRRTNGWSVEAPKQVENHPQLLDCLTKEIGNDGIAVVGFDFPIGIPAKYASLIGVAEFRHFLPRLGTADYLDFYRVCAEPSEISHYRPFYPYRPGGANHNHLLSALDLTKFDDLRRMCERAHDDRKAACPLFWTLGANQVGKAAIIGWRDVIIPALENNDSVLLWPFDGPLNQLLKPGKIVIVETYPAEYYRWFFRDQRLKSKGELADRRRVGPSLLEWAKSARQGVELSFELRSCILAGFEAGDDAFDAAVGLLGMLEVLINGRSSGEPQEPCVKKLEGWILGQSCQPNTCFTFAPIGGGTE
jgi:hypothetical protein